MLRSKSINPAIIQTYFLLFAIIPFVGIVTDKSLGYSPHQFLNILGLGILYLLIFERGVIKFPLYVLPLFFFFVFTILSDIYIVNREIDFSYIRNNRYLGGIIILLILENISFSKNFKSYLWKSSLIIIIVAIVTIILQQLFDSSFFTRDIGDASSIREDRLSSIYTWNDAGPMSLGLCFFPVLAVMIGDILKHTGKINSQVIAFMVMGFVVAVLNRARISLVFIFFMFILIPIYQGLSMKNVLKYILILVVFLSVAIGSMKVIGVDMVGYVNDRVLEKSEGGLLHGDAGNRVFAFKVFAMLFPNSPVVGAGKKHTFDGSGTKDVVLEKIIKNKTSQIHVGYLSLFYYYGAVGGGFYLLFLIVFTIRLYNRAKYMGYWGPFIGWLMYLLNNWTDVYLYFDILGIVILLCFEKYYYDNHSPIDQTAIAI